jgi:hypothetical protein
MTQSRNSSDKTRARRSRRLRSCIFAAVLAAVALALSSCSGSGNGKVQASGPTITVGVTKVARKSVGREITLSSELVPFLQKAGFSIHCDFSDVGSCCRLHIA